MSQFLKWRDHQFCLNFMQLNLKCVMHSLTVTLLCDVSTVFISNQTLLIFSVSPTSETAWAISSSSNSSVHPVS